uniref:Uncharacterized protein n=1 Tax=Oryza brachyantha TaxID=4533 RepID=J3N8Z8_ORYBR
MKTSHIMIFSLVLLVLSSDTEIAAARATSHGTLAPPDCKTILLPAYCDDIKTCIPLCSHNDPLNPVPSQLLSVICLDLGCQCTFCPKAA